jgi:DNA-binding XRE family transcriptional regulator
MGTVLLGECGYAPRFTKAAMSPSTQDSPDQTLANVLRQLRRDNGGTQEDVAHYAGITVAALARIERGQTNPRWTTLRRIVNALDISLAELVAAVENAPV